MGRIEIWASSESRSMPIRTNLFKCFICSWNIHALTLRFLCFPSQFSLAFQEILNYIKNAPDGSRNWLIILKAGWVILKFTEYIEIQRTIHWCSKWHLLQQQKHPQKRNSHNIKLYDFYLNVIHFILIFKVNL